LRAQWDTVAKAKADVDWLKPSQALLDTFFARVAAQYNGEAAAALGDWLERYFVDQERAIRFWMWGGMLRQITGVWPYSAGPSPLSPESTELSSSVVHAYFGTDAQQEVDAAIARAREIPVSAIERDLVMIKGPHEPEAGVEPEAGIVRVLDYERTRKTWAQLEGSLRSAELDALQHWVQREAARQNKPTDVFRLPPR
jgi:hypothetical protein